MAPQDTDKAPTNLLRQSLGDSGGACPEPEILAAYFDRALDASDTARFELHFSQCPRCREQLAAMNRATESAAAESSKSPAASHWAWLWDWRALAPAAAVLVIASLWIARRPASNKVAELKSQPPLVAMSRPNELPEASTSTPAREQSETSPAKPAPKAFAAPSGSGIGGVVQPRAREESPALDDKEKFAANLPQIVGNEVRSNEIAKDERALKRDSSSADYDAKKAESSRAAAPSAPPPPQPTASANSGALRGNTETVTVTAETDSLAPASPTTRAKPTGAPVGARTLTQQAQTQSALQSKALALEAVAKLSSATVISTPDPRIVWRIADGGFVERSNDSGLTWQGQLPDETAQLTAGSAPSPRICWLVGRDGVILITKDARRWKRISPPLKTDFVGVTAKDASSATVTASGGRKFTTADGGKHWNLAP